jgi:hypothetical protein
MFPLLPLMGTEGVKPNVIGQQNIYLNENGILDSLDKILAIQNYTDVIPFAELFYIMELTIMGAFAKSLQIK